MEIEMNPPTFKRSSWRLIKTAPARGAWNMALDEALLEGMHIEPALPVMRLFAWEPPCLSLGVAQPAADVNMPALQARGWDLVRRPTGGRAILHTDELTYSVIGPHTEARLAGSVLESYQRLSLALLEALHLLAVPARSEAEPLLPASSDPKGPVCFEVPSNYEITVNGKKLIGSAQARRKEGVLQHGSLPLYGDLQRITQVLNFDHRPDSRGISAQAAAADRLIERATTIEACLGIVLTWEAAAEAFVTAFQSVLNLDFIPSEPSNLELLRAEELAREKYAHPSWTNRI
jgi:lipoate-protein ligase A